MTEADAYIAVLEMGYYEVTFAFEGLANEHVWKRPAEGLLSVGELAGHIAYWHATRLAGDGEDPANCRIKSPLIDQRFSYYPRTLGVVPADHHLTVTAEQVCKELVRVNKETLAYFRELNPDLGAHPPGQPSFWTYGEAIKYAAFHVAYHTGQMYTVRHLLGEQPPDN